MLEGGANRTLGNFVEGDATNALAAVFLFALGFLFLLLGLGSVAQFFGQVGGNGFAFAVRVRRQIDLVGG